MISYSRFRDLRLAVLNRSDPVGRRLLRLSRQWVSVRYDLVRAADAKAKLRAAMVNLSMDHLNALAFMWVADSRICGATGAGMDFAQAAVIINEVAIEILGERPTFEIVG